MSKEEGDILMQIKSNDQLLMKLMATSLLLETARGKVNKYMKNNQLVIQEMLEDEEALHYMSLYYEENTAELLQASEESVSSANEVEDTDYWREELNGN
ncbi:hypothetical protein ACTHAL_003380 [Priestia flexa]|uniref:hypothetical protein n=1 Tax=Priestia flexa TaxID=86664 RepID=UPI003F829BBA